MKLSELLDELRSNILHDRAQPYLWSDTTLVRYINESQRRFARKGLILRDATTPEVVNVTLETGVTQYTLHPSVLAVVSAKVNGAAADLQRVGHSLLGAPADESTLTWDPSFEAWPDGAPRAYTTDEQVAEGDDGAISSVSMRVWPTPDAATNGTVVKLRVVRMPLDDLTTQNLSAVPEIPADHQIEMLDWAAYLALRIADVDAGNPRRAADYAATFEAHVAEARKVVMRKLFAPAGWGFGRNGWSWGH